MRQLSHPNCDKYIKTGRCEIFCVCQILHGVECVVMTPVKKRDAVACRAYARRSERRN